jgi:hypothetical protein
MAKLEDILIHILEEYPHKDELSNARLTKLVYLSDWYNSIHNNQQISHIDWYFDNYGPFVWDIYREVDKNPRFKISYTLNLFGTEKKLIKLINTKKVNLTTNEITSINKIIEATEYLNYEKFINLVYSTYPILTTEKYNRLDLVNKAKYFNREKHNKAEERNE